MTAVMQGVRVLEVAEHTFVPAASALLADWGAEVIKIEHVERGDAMRGLASSGVGRIAGGVHALLEHSNRGKKSLGLDLTSPTKGSTSSTSSPRPRRLPHQQAARACAPSSGSTSRTSGPTTRTSSTCAAPGRASGVPTPTRARTTVWPSGAASGIAIGCQAGRSTGTSSAPPAPGFGDSIGAMTIAGGIMGALFHRERPARRRSSTCRCSASAMWVDGPAIALSLLQQTSRGCRRPSDAARRQPAGRTTTSPRTAAASAFCCLQAGKYWPELCDVIGRPELATDPRFADHVSLLEQRADADRRSSPRPSPSGRWPSGGSGWQTSPVSGPSCRTRSRSPTIPQTVANGYVQDCETADGTPFRLAAAPVQFDEEPPAAEAGARVQRARRRDPRRARARLGHHRRPQGPRRRRLTRLLDHGAGPALGGGRPSCSRCSGVRSSTWTGRCRREGWGCRSGPGGRGERVADGGGGTRREVGGVVGATPGTGRR